MNNLLKQQLSADLNISKFSIETEEEYGNRLIYSALVAWARVQVLGRSYTDINSEADTELDYHNADVMHIQTRLSQVAYGVLNAIPHRSEWIKNSDFEICSNELSNVIVKHLIFCYELSKVNNRRLTTSPIKTINFISNQLLVGGTKWKGEKLYSVGIGRWVTNSVVPVDFQDAFNIPKYSAIEYYKALKTNAIWQENDLDGIYQILKINNAGWYSNTWVDFNKATIPTGVSLLKNMETDGGYFLIKNDVEGILSAKLDKWYYDEKEIYRIIYSLRAFNKTPAIFKAKNNKDHILLHCNSRLPNPEMRILLMSSWPQNVYEDRFKRIIPEFLWDDIEKCLNDLGIIIQFEN